MESRTSTPVGVKVILLLMGCATCMAYLPGLTVFFLADGFVHIHAHLNAPVTRFITANWLGQTGIGGHYRPLFNIVHWWLPRVFGLKPIPYHVFEYSLQFLVCGGLFWLAYRISKSTSAAVVAVLLFSAHRLNVWSVVWVHSGLAIYGLFYVLTILSLYVSRDSAPSLRRSLTTGSLSFLAYVGREGALTIPIVGSVFLVCFSHGSLRRRVHSAIQGILPALIALVVYAAIRTIVLGGVGSYFGTDYGPSFDLSDFTEYGEHLGNLWLPGGLLPATLVVRDGVSLLNQVFRILVGLPIALSILIAVLRLPGEKRYQGLGLLAWTVLAPIYAWGSGSVVWRLYTTALGWALLIALLIGSSLEGKPRYGSLPFLSLGGILLYWALHLVAFTNDLGEFKRAGVIAHTIIEETVQKIPDPPSDGLICFENVPSCLPSGAPVFFVGLEEGLRLWYQDERFAVSRDCDVEGQDEATHLLRWDGEHIEHVSSTKYGFSDE